MTRIVLHIDKLVLRGIDRADAKAVSVALKAELRARLGGELGMVGLAASNGLAIVQAGSARVPHGANAALLGRAVGARIAGAGSKP